jgi:hypothetical protein
MNVKPVGIGLLLLFATASVAAQGIHIDGSSEAAANKSYQRMVNSLDGKKKDELVTAVLQLNMVGVESADDAPTNATAGRIRDRIGGLTAAEIIDLAHRTATNTTVTVKRVPSGPPSRP